MLSTLALIVLMEVTAGMNADLSPEDDLKLRNVVTDWVPRLSTMIDSTGFPHQYLIMPEQFLAIYGENPQAAVGLLLKIVEHGSTKDAHKAYMLAFIRDGHTGGKQGLAYWDHREIDTPDEKGITSRSQWVKYVEKLHAKLKEKEKQ